MVHCVLVGRQSRVKVTAQSRQPLSTEQRGEVIRQLRTCLRLTEDLSEFHREARRHAQYRWIAARKTGRMLRAPTAFEDILKMMCTTNCTWALTTLMVNNIVRDFGPPFTDGLAGFPPPAAIARSTERFLRNSCKTGYRAPFILEFARRVANGELDVEAWRTSSVPTDELFTQLRGIKGIGPYAAGNILKLLGRYEHLGLDSWVRAKYYELNARGRKVKDSTIERRYQHLGPWRGLFFWLEMTKDWHDDKFPTVL